MRVNLIGKSESGIIKWNNYIKIESLRSLIRKVRTWRRFSKKERSLFLQALILLPVIALSLRVWGLQRTKKVLAWLPSENILLPLEAQAPVVAKTTRMVNIATHYSPLWTNCLKKSLVLWYLLQRQGITSELRIGVRHDDGEFTAHAWVEYQGVVLSDRQNVGQHYTVFNSLISKLNNPLLILQQAQKEKQT
jgi:hypothetical protein